MRTRAHRIAAHIMPPQPPPTFATVSPFFPQHSFALSHSHSRTHEFLPSMFTQSDTVHYSLTHTSIHANREHAACSRRARACVRIERTANRVRVDFVSLARETFNWAKHLPSAFDHGGRFPCSFPSPLLSCSRLVLVVRGRPTGLVGMVRTRRTTLSRRPPAAISVSPRVDRRT